MCIGLGTAPASQGFANAMSSTTDPKKKLALSIFNTIAAVPRDLAQFRNVAATTTTARPKTRTATFG